MDAVTFFLTETKWFQMIINAFKSFKYLKFIVKSVTCGTQT